LLFRAATLTLIGLREPAIDDFHRFIRQLVDVTLSLKVEFLIFIPAVCF